MDQWSRRQFLQGVAGLGLLAGCGRLPGQEPPPKVARIGYLGDARNRRFDACREGAAGAGLR
jgi:hypothetical protein